MAWGRSAPCFVMSQVSPSLLSLACALGRHWRRGRHLLDDAENVLFAQLLSKLGHRLQPDEQCSAVANIQRRPGLNFLLCLCQRLALPDAAPALHHGHQPPTGHVDGVPPVVDGAMQPEQPQAVA